MFCIAVLSTMILGCAHTPKEAVSLSEELLVMTESAKSSHLAMLDEYIAERRRQVDTFMSEKWIPVFMDDAIKNTNLLNLIENEKDLDEKANIITKNVSGLGNKKYIEESNASILIKDNCIETIKVSSDIGNYITKYNYLHL